MNTPDTPTPRTTEQVFSYPIMVEISDGDWEERQGLAVPADFARQLERELTAAKEENARLAKSLETSRAYCSKLDGILEEVGDVTVSCINPYEDIKRAFLALQAELALLRKRVEAADGLAEEAQILANILRANTDVHGRCLLERDMTIGLRAALLTFRATEGKK